MSMNQCAFVSSPDSCKHSFCLRPTMVRHSTTYVSHSELGLLIFYAGQWLYRLFLMNKQSTENYGHDICRTGMCVIFISENTQSLQPLPTYRHLNLLTGGNMVFWVMTPYILIYFVHVLEESAASIFNSEDRGIKFLWNVGNHLPYYLVPKVKYHNLRVTRELERKECITLCNSYWIHLNSAARKWIMGTETSSINSYLLINVYFFTPAAYSLCYFSSYKKFSLSRACCQLMSWGPYCRFIMSPCKIETDGTDGEHKFVCHISGSQKLT
jgi:hypothetical protein